MYYVYIMKSLIDKTHYVGLTASVERRFTEHNRGKNLSTKAKKPWKLIHVEVVEERKEARILEKFFKNGYGREIIQEIEQIEN